MISVIIPTFNRVNIGGRNNLAMTLRGLELQTNKDFEVIVVDDGSTDGTDKWMKENKDSYSFPMKYHFMGENKGYRQCKARNQGVRMADEESIAYLFLDSDIILEPDTVQKYADHYKANQNRVIIGMYYWGFPVKTEIEDISNFKELFSENRPTIEGATPHGMQGIDPRFEMFDATEPDQLHWKMGTYLGCWGGNLLVPKHIFMDVAEGQKEANPKDNTDEYCGYDEHYTAPVEDGDFGLMLMRRGWAISMDKTIYAYHLWHPRNIANIQEANGPDVKYLDTKYETSVLDETKIVQREEYKLE